jgi:hypothetical protein
MNDLHTLAGELIAAIRMNTMRGTWVNATTEQVDEWLKPFVERLGSATPTLEAAAMKHDMGATDAIHELAMKTLEKTNADVEARRK